MHFAWRLFPGLGFPPRRSHTTPRLPRSGTYWSCVQPVVDDLLRRFSRPGRGTCASADHGRLVMRTSWPRDHAGEAEPISLIELTAAAAVVKPASFASAWVALFPVRASDQLLLGALATAHPPAGLTLRIGLAFSQSMQNAKPDWAPTQIIWSTIDSLMRIVAVPADSSIWFCSRKPSAARDMLHSLHAW